MNKGILILTPFFSPNIGGVETHLDDLASALDLKGFNVFVQSYSPLTTRGVKWLRFERKGERIEITRYRWFGKELFHKLEKFPFFDFLYLTPYLFLRTLFWMIRNNKKIDVIHAHGLNAAIIGLAFKKIYKKKLVVSTHAIYELNKDCYTARWIVLILKKSDKVLALSKGSQKELESFGLAKDKIDIYKHWIDLNNFKNLNIRETLREEFSLKNSFTVLYLGRMIEKKGIRILAEIARELPTINFLFVGDGPDLVFLKEQERRTRNINVIGQIKNKETVKFYNASDCFCLPSQYEEGFGRVLMEAVACEIPIIASNRGGIPEALSEEVSILVNPIKEDIKTALEKLVKDKLLYSRLKNNCRDYAKKNFSSQNVSLVTRYY